jgi:hypothetical protein
MTATAYTAVGVILAGCAAYAASVLAGHERPARYAVTRARWAWRCRGRPPVRDEGGERLTREEAQALGNLAAGRDVRART